MPGLVEDRAAWLPASTGPAQVIISRPVHASGGTSGTGDRAIGSASALDSDLDAGCRVSQSLQGIPARESPGLAGRQAQRSGPGPRGAGFSLVTVAAHSPRPVSAGHWSQRSSCAEPAAGLQNEDEETSAIHVNKAGWDQRES